MFTIILGTKADKENEIEIQFLVWNPQTLERDFMDKRPERTESFVQRHNQFIRAVE